MSHKSSRRTAPYRAALIGCGAVGSLLSEDPLRRGAVPTHAEAYANSQRAKLIAVCDADASRLQRCGKKWRVPAQYADFSKMIREQSPEIVSVCTPDATHAEILEGLLEEANGIKAIWCEKPLTTNVAQAQQLSARAAARGILLAVNYTRRYLEGIRRLKQFMQKAELGAVQAVSGWHTKGVLHNGSHWFDLLRLLVGEVERVRAFDRLKEGGSDPTLDVRLWLGNGVVAHLQAANDAHYAIFEMDLLTTHGRILLTEFATRARLFRAQPSSRFTGYSELVEMKPDWASARSRPANSLALEDLLSALENSHAPACTAADGMAALKIAVAALDSAREGREVALTP